MKRIGGSSRRSGHRVGKKLKWFDLFQWLPFRVIFQISRFTFSGKLWLLNILDPHATSPMISEVMMRSMNLSLGRYSMGVCWPYPKFYHQNFFGDWCLADLEDDDTVFWDIPTIFLGANIFQIFDFSWNKCIRQSYIPFWVRNGKVMLWQIWYLFLGSLNFQEWVLLQNKCDACISQGWQCISVWIFGRESVDTQVRRSKPRC